MKDIALRIKEWLNLDSFLKLDILKQILIPEVQAILAEKFIILDSQ